MPAGIDMVGPVAGTAAGRGAVADRLGALGDPSPARDRVGDAGRAIAVGGLRYAAGIRGVTIVSTVAIAVMAADPGAMLVRVVLAAAVLAAWSCCYLAMVLRDAPPWVSVVDAGLLVALAAATPWLLPADWLGTGKSWLKPFLTFACVGYQYSTPSRLGVPLAAGVALSAGLATNAAMAQGPTPDTLVTACWSFATAMLARLLWEIVGRAGKTADAAMLAMEAARRDREIAARLRADEQAVVNALHDTSATTLLMVGLGEASGLGGTLNRRAEHDLSVLRDLHEGAQQPDADLRELLTRSVALLPIGIRFAGPQELTVPAAVARVLADATHEAVANASRHSHADTVTVEFDGDQSHARVVVRDEGIGFAPDTVPSTRRGLRDSVVGRMESIGGRVTIESAPGRGTVVRLTWPT